MAHKNETLAKLDDMIAQAEARLALNPDYIELAVLKKARHDIAAAAHRTITTLIDDQTGEELALVPTGKFAKHRLSQIEASAMVLTEAGVPLTTPQMVAAAVRKGAKIGGKNPNINLGSTLSRSEEFVSVRWNGESAWWFKNKPLPPESRTLLKAAE